MRTRKLRILFRFGKWKMQIGSPAGTCWIVALYLLILFIFLHSSCHQGDPDDREPNESSSQGPTLFWTLCVCTQSIQLFWDPKVQPTRLLCPWTFSKQEYWSELLFPTPGGLSDPGIEPCMSCIGRQILYHWATWEAIADTLNLFYLSSSVNLTHPERNF